MTDTSFPTTSSPTSPTPVAHALVTGASRGLGLALAERLVAAGARVSLVARDPDALAAAARRLGPAAVPIAADVADPDAAARVVGLAVARSGPIDLLVHAASTLGPVPLRPLADTDPADLERAFAVNVVGPARLVQAVVGAMVLAERGTIVFVSSDAAVEAYPGWGAYGATKAAADHLARTLAAELEGTGVRVLAIDPGEMDTQMHADAVPDADRSQLADPADVARVIVSALAAPTPSGARLVVPRPARAA